MSERVRAFFFCIAATAAIAIGRFLGIQWWILAIGPENGERVAFWACFSVAIAAIALFIGRPYRLSRYLETYPLKGEGLSFLRSYPALAFTYLAVLAISTGACLGFFGTGRSSVYLTLTATLAAPLLEIPILYGGLWKRLTDVGWNPYAGSVLLAASGALIRLSFWRDDLTELSKSGLIREEDSLVAFVFILILRVFLAFGLGILYGMARKKYKSILPPLCLRVLAAILFR